MQKDSTAHDPWLDTLSPERYAVLRQKATEAPFSGKLLYQKAAGKYVCGACGAELFNSEAKFDSNCGWPSFYDAKPGAVDFRTDTSLGVHRTEVLCAHCGSHLGHIFDDAPDQPTGKRYCINSLALDFKRK